MAIHLPVKQAVAAAAVLLAACGSAEPPTSSSSLPISFANNPCGPGQPIQLGVGQTSLVDCSNGGEKGSLTGCGAGRPVGWQQGRADGELHGARGELPRRGAMRGEPGAEPAVRLQPRLRD